MMLDTFHFFSRTDLTFIYFIFDLVEIIFLLFGHINSDHAVIRSNLQTLDEQLSYIFI